MRGDEKSPVVHDQPAAVMQAEFGTGNERKGEMRYTSLAVAGQEDLIFGDAHEPLDRKSLRLEQRTACPLNT